MDTYINTTPLDNLQIKVNINCDTDKRFEDAPMSEDEVKKAIAYAAEHNDEEFDDLVERVLDDETFKGFWTWLANFILTDRREGK